MFLENQYWSPKINSLILSTYEIAIDGLCFQDKWGRDRFFEETFLLIDFSMEVILVMLFLSFNNADMRFSNIRGLT